MAVIRDPQISELWKGGIFFISLKQEGKRDLAFACFVLERTLSRLAHWGKNPLFPEGKKKKNGVRGGENPRKQMEIRTCLQQFFDPPVKTHLMRIWKTSRFLRHLPAGESSTSPIDSLPLVHLPNKLLVPFLLEKPVQLHAELTLKTSRLENILILPRMFESSLDNAFLCHPIPCECLGFSSIPCGNRADQDFQPTSFLYEMKIWHHPPLPECLGGENLPCSKQISPPWTA